MRQNRRSALVLSLPLALVLVACGEKRDAAPPPPRAPAAGHITAGPPPSDSLHDADVAAQGAGLPAGYFAQLDTSTAKITDVSYSPAGTGRWEVRTGPAHLLYMRHDTASVHYTLSATFEQLEKPAHPEAFGVFWGGSALNKPAKQRYTYFLVRGDGKYMVKVRNGADTRTITDWTAHVGIPRENSSGKGVYGISVTVDGKSARVSVNGIPVATVDAKDAPTKGIAGVRINHNLHLNVTPATIVR